MKVDRGFACPVGESTEQVAARPDRVIARVRAAAGDVAPFMLERGNRANLVTAARFAFLVDRSR